MGEDALFSYEIFLYIDKVVGVDMVSYNRRIRPGSACTAYSLERNIKVFKSYYNLYYVLLGWIESGHYNPMDKCNNLETLQIKLINTRENVARCLAMISDRKVVRKYLKQIKQEGIYPYKDENHYINRTKGLKGFLIYHINNGLAFWIVHFLYRVKRNK